MNKKILIVEDDQYIAKGLKELLEDEGYHVEYAKNGKIALDYLHAESSLPSLILLDIMMPIMNGIQFRVEQARDKRLFNIPVVVMSAVGDIEVKKDRISADAIIQKPFELETILKIAEHYCH